MPIYNLKVRYIIAIIWSLGLSIFGVFIFSNFVYRGVRLDRDIFPHFTAGTFIDFVTGLYLLVGSGFSSNLFSLFSISNLQSVGFFGILFGQTLWPTILTWFSVGLIIGIFVKGIKHSLITALLVYVGLIILYFLVAMFAGVNLAGGNIFTTLSELLTSLIILIPATILSGFINGPH
ncbi:MAG: hypothetical protein DRO88_03860 [Promethearchaeia archaeon]|nr:MAG: hypothetical protein DRO88_03860 [Candidatus Lokiarchaeia archaeon]